MCHLNRAAHHVASPCGDRFNPRHGCRCCAHPIALDIATNSTAWMQMLRPLHPGHRDKFHGICCAHSTPEHRDKSYGMAIYAVPSPPPGHRDKSYGCALSTLDISPTLPRTSHLNRPIPPHGRTWLRPISHPCTSQPPVYTPNRDTSRHISTITVTLDPQSPSPPCTNKGIAMSMHIAMPFQKPLLYQ